MISFKNIGFHCLPPSPLSWPPGNIFQCPHLGWIWWILIDMYSLEQYNWLTLLHKLTAGWSWFKALILHQLPDIKTARKNWTERQWKYSNFVFLSTFWHNTYTYDIMLMSTNHTTRLNHVPVVILAINGIPSEHYLMGWLVLMNGWQANCYPRNVSGFPCDHSAIFLTPKDAWWGR